MRRWLKVASVLLLVSFLGLGVCKSYYFLRKERFLYLARQHLEKGEDKEASFYAKLTLLNDQKNEKAMAILAKIDGKTTPLLALHWNGLRAENNPRNADCLLDFARSLLQAGQTDSADKVLGKAAALPGADPIRLGELQAVLALSRRHPDQAEGLYRKMIADHPKKASIRFSLAGLLLTSGPSKREEGRTILQELWKKQEMPLQASRSLVHLSLFEKNLGQAGPWIDFLQNSPDSNLSDQYLSGEALLAGGNTLSPDWFKKLTGKCHQPGDVYASLRWLRQNSQQEQALKWFDTLPQAWKESFPARLGRAETLADLARWEQLIKDLNEENWGNSEHFRYAFLRQAHLKTGTNLEALAQRYFWSHMINSLVKKPDDFYRFSDLLQHWSWPDITRDDFLSDVTARMELLKAPLLALIHEAEMRRDTLALYYLGKLALKLDPASVVAGNNLANYGLLLQKEPDHSQKLAKDLFQKHPEIPAVRLTAAFALYRQQHLSEAKALMEALSPEALHQPGAALYYGIILRATGKTAEAREYLEIARKSTKLLPEESALLQEQTSTDSVR